MCIATMFRGEIQRKGCTERFFFACRQTRHGSGVNWSSAKNRVDRAKCRICGKIGGGGRTRIGNALSVPSEKVPQPPKIYVNFREVPRMFKAQ